MNERNDHEAPRDEHEHEHEHELDPIAALHDADPAAGVEARAGFADELVARAAADAAAEQAGMAQTGMAQAGMAEAPAAEASTAVADLATERARRRPRWAAVAAVAASLVVIGGAGYWAGATTGSGSEMAAAPPITLQSGAGAESAAGGTMGGAMGAAEQSKMAAGSSDLWAPYGFGRNSFHASGLSTTGGDADGYAYDARSVSNTESVAALAAALGLAGTPELKDGSWIVGSQDGTAATLWVGLDGTASFSYSDPTLNPWKCSEDGSGCEPVGTLPSEAAAIEALQALITASGRDAGAFEYTSEDWEGAVTRMAQAWPVVDGQRLDQAWSLELAEGGTVSASGQLAGLVSLGAYPIVSEQEAFERLSDPRFGAQSTIMPLAMRGGGVVLEGEAVAPADQWVPPTEPPAAPAAGAAISWTVNQVEIVSARLGLTSQWQPDGSVIVVPAYEFTDADGGTWSVIAVAESALDFTSGQ